MGGMVAQRRVYIFRTLGYHPPAGIRRRVTFFGQTIIPSAEPTHHQLAPVVENRPLPSSHFLLTLDCPPVALSALPGQFVMLHFPDRLDPLLPRPMSISEVLPGPEGAPARIRILHKVVGKGTALLSALSPGDRLQILGPLGRPFQVPPPAPGREKALMVAGGIGIAIFPFLVPALKKAGWNPTLLFGARSEEDLVRRDFFPEQDVELRVATEDGSAGTRGRVTTLLQQALSTGSEAGMVYACGPRPMLRAVAALVNAASVPCQLSLEATMGCGFGVCLGCVVRVRRGEESTYARVCVEGPTMMATEVLWE